MLFCLKLALQVVDGADTTESERTEALRSTPSRDPDDLETDQPDELRDKQSPRSPRDTKKVMKNVHEKHVGCHVFRLRMQEMQDKERGKIRTGEQG